ncbi:hypothetical protein [Methanoregula sp.]|jgi:predicted transcriptional regulator|uniref:hypothetical protein n=1 Tax=Methanoregula sp. TaxID=2052170 RepID=UPI002603B57C|nr:hypothetical protein [Methanoregula sp.]MDD5144220.1 hypothetical protein [Methanoregula sp.]
MAGRGWVTSEELRGEKKGRPEKKIALAIPVREIMEIIGAEKEAGVKDQLSLVKKAREYAR